MNTSPSENTTTEKNTPGNVKLMREIYDWVEIFVITISAILLLFTFFIRIAFVDGNSMNPTLIDEETLAVSNLFYTPKQGDIIVFQAPDSRVEGGLVKRVIAVGGQTVDIDFDTWTVTVDGVVLDEPFIKELPEYIDGFRMRKVDMDFPLTVPEGHVFAMGDNRNNSHDSRESDIGFVDTRYIFGRVLFRITPFNKFGPVD